MAALFSIELRGGAESLLETCRHRGLRLATAESCTGGLLAALLTEIPGSSDVFDRAFVTYSNAAKHDMLGVSEEAIAGQGAVSEEVARAMADGALARSRADIAISITGIAGPGGGSDTKPVGLVWFATAARHNGTRAEVWRFGDIGREAVRLESLSVALDLVQESCAAVRPRSARDWE